MCVSLQICLFLNGKVPLRKINGKLLLSLFRRTHITLFDINSNTFYFMPSKSKQFKTSHKKPHRIAEQQQQKNTIFHTGRTGQKKKTFALVRFGLCSQAKQDDIYKITSASRKENLKSFCVFEGNTEKSHIQCKYLCIVF